MGGRVNPVQAGRIFAQDFPLDFQAQINPLLFANIIRQLKGHQLIDQPLGRPDGVIAAEKDLVWPYPKQQVRPTLASPCRRASPEFPSRHHDVVLRGALVTVSGGYHHTCCRDAVRAHRDRRRASPRRRAALPPPQWTHGGSHPASTFGDPLAQEVRQSDRVMLPKIWVGTAIDRDRRHTPAGATLPHGSVPLQGMPVMIEEHMATHRSLSSPWRSCTTAHNNHTDDLALFLALRQLASVTQRQREHQENTVERSLRSRRFYFQIKRQCVAPQAQGWGRRRGDRGAASAQPQGHREARSEAPGGWAETRPS